jgi:hypothetical protein
MINVDKNSICQSKPTNKQSVSLLSLEFDEEQTQDTLKTITLSLQLLQLTSSPRDDDDSSLLAVVVGFSSDQRDNTMGQ